jgi:hypothetical protein
VHNCAERLVQPRHAGDALQRPLRSRCRARLMPGVDMTSDAKSSSEMCYVIIFIAAQLVIGSGGASQKRRLIRLISVGWVPPDWRPSGAGLDLGTRVSFSLFTPSRVAPHWGCASSDRHGKPGALLVQWRSVCWTDGVTGTCLAIAPIKPTSSRAIATTTWWACCPRAIRRRKRLHSHTCAFQLISWMALGCCSSRRCRCRLTLAGSR